MKLFPYHLLARSLIFGIVWVFQGVKITLAATDIPTMIIPHDMLALCALSCSVNRI